MIIYKEGDLFSSNAEALVHGCNTIGRMNRGIAKEFRYNFPEMYQDYLIRCRNGSFLPGTGYIFLNSTQPHVINLATQADGLAKIEYVASTLEWLSQSEDILNLKTIAMPRIASGLGGLEWTTVKNLIKEKLENSTFDIEIWSLA